MYIGFFIHTSQYQSGWGKDGITSGLKTREVRQSQLLMWMELRTVLKATGTEELTSRYLASLLLLVKAVPIWSILYPQTVCTSGKKKSSTLMRIQRTANKVSHDCHRENWPDLAGLPAQSFCRTAFMSLHGSLCFKMTSMYFFFSQNSCKGRVLSVLMETNLGRRKR